MLSKKLVHYMQNATLVVMTPKNVNECLREILSTGKLGFISLSYIMQLLYCLLMVFTTLLAENLIVLKIYIYIIYTYIYIYMHIYIYISFMENFIFCAVKKIE